MDQPKEQHELEEAASKRQAMQEARRKLPKDVRRFLAEMDAERGPDGETYGHRD